MTTDATQVTQADREAAAGCIARGVSHPSLDSILSGEKDSWFFVQAFARHRETTTATLTAQVEALTAERDALRGKMAELADHFEEKANEEPYGPRWAPLRYAATKVRAALASTSEGEGA